MTGPVDLSPGPDIKSLLNEAQYQAATHENGPLLIVAGAGTGKTRTLVHRVAWLVERGYAPASILLLTFTRKAAAEMLSRSVELAGLRAGQVSGGTFHSLANLSLRKWASAIGYTSSFNIIDQDDACGIITRLRGSRFSFKIPNFPKTSTIQNILSQAVNRGISLTTLIKRSYAHLESFSGELQDLQALYQEHKLKNDLMDFDDLLVNLEKLFLENEPIRLKAAQQYTQIMVDEYQDTNHTQARLTHLLGKDHRNVTAVGDEAQSIYSFRGANFRNIMDFPKLFPESRIIKLEDNYRSTPEILSVANNLLKQAKVKYDKTLRSLRPSGQPPQIVMADDLAGEAQTVLDQIKEDLDSGLPASDMAVLFRAGAHSFELETLLTKDHMPYRKFGGRKFLEMAHIKDFISYLRLAARPNDAQSFRRVLGHLPGLGTKGSENVIKWALERGDYALFLEQAPVVSQKARKSLGQLAKLLVVVMRPGVSSHDIIKSVFSYYSELLPDLYPDDYPSRLTDLGELNGIAQTHSDLVSFLADLTLDPPNTLSVGEAQPARDNELTLSTIHSAKGLEWRNVYIISAAEGRFPSAFSRTKEDLEEELRLMYVAVTRARDQLIITAPMTDQYPDSGEINRFLKNLNSTQVKLVSADDRNYLDDDFDHSDSFDQNPANPAASASAGRGFWNFYGDRQGLALPDPAALKLPGQRPSINHPLINDYSPSKKPVTVHQSPDFVTEPAPGQRVKHPVLGLGKVVRVIGDKVIIDFDALGPRTVLTRFAKLVAADS
jgi:DNA helicase-2/ATP-dependent DNA helicase PcrA